MGDAAIGEIIGGMVSKHCLTSSWGEAIRREEQPWTYVWRGKKRLSP